MTCEFVACGGALAPSSDSGEVVDGSVRDAVADSDAQDLGDVATSLDADHHGDADAQATGDARASVDGGSCSTSADCATGRFCVVWSDVYNSGNNGIACLPLPSGCNTCGCAVQAAQADTMLACYCVDGRGQVLGADASPVAIFCSQA